MSERRRQLTSISQDYPADGDTNRGALDAAMGFSGRKSRLSDELVKEKAVLSIQISYRARQARRAADEAQREQQPSAALKVQALHRGNRARCEVEVKKQEQRQRLAAEGAGAAEAAREQAESKLSALQVHASNALLLADLPAAKQTAPSSAGGASEGGGGATAGDVADAVLMGADAALQEKETEMAALKTRLDAAISAGEDREFELEQENDGALSEFEGSLAQWAEVALAEQSEKAMATQAEFAASKVNAASKQTAPMNEPSEYVCVCKECHCRMVVPAEDEAALLVKLASWQDGIPELAAKREMDRDDQERKAAEMHRTEQEAAAAAQAVAEAAAALASAEAAAVLAEYEAHATVLADEAARLQDALRVMEQRLCRVEAERSGSGVQLQFQEHQDGPSRTSWTPAVAAELKLRAHTPERRQSGSPGAYLARRSEMRRSSRAGLMPAQPVRNISMPASQLPREWARRPGTSPRHKFVPGVSDAGLSEPPSGLDRYYVFASSPRVMAERPPSQSPSRGSADIISADKSLISRQVSEPGWVSLVVSAELAPSESPSLQTLGQEERIQQQLRLETSSSSFVWRLAQHRATSYDASAPSLGERRREVLGLAGTSTMRSSLGQANLLGQARLSDQLAAAKFGRPTVTVGSPLWLAERHRSPVGLAAEVGS